MILVRGGTEAKSGVTGGGVFLGSLGLGAGPHSVLLCCVPGFAAVHKNMPTVAGGLRWAQELRQRIQGPFANFRRMAHP